MRARPKPLPTRMSPEGNVLQRTTVSAAPIPAVPSVVHDVLRSPGQPLDTATRTSLEPRFGHDFSGVRVHTDDRATLSARAVDAQAYTVGRDVVFGAGRYAPGTKAGGELLAHELTHVAQQTASSVGRGGDLMVSPSASAEEQEADAAARRVSGGDSLDGPVRPAPCRIQRKVFTPEELKAMDAARKPSDPMAKMGLLPSVEDFKTYTARDLIPPTEVKAPPKEASKKDPPTDKTPTDKTPVPAPSASAMLEGGTRMLATFDADRGQGKRPWNLNQLTKDVVAALDAAPNAYIRVFGIYSQKSTEDDPKDAAYGRADTVRKALIQWIGPKRFDEGRYEASVGTTLSGPESADQHQIEVWVAYKSKVLSAGPGGSENEPKADPAQDTKEPAAKEVDGKPGVGLQAGAGAQVTPRSNDPRVQNDPLVKYVQVTVTLHDAYLIEGKDIAPWLKNFSFLGEPGAQLQYHLSGTAPGSVDAQVLFNAVQASLEVWKHKLDISLVAGGMVNDLKAFKLKDAGKRLTPIPVGVDAELGLVKISPSLKLTLDVQGLVGLPYLDAAGGKAGGRKAVVQGSGELRLVVEF